MKAKRFVSSMLCILMLLCIIPSLSGSNAYDGIIFLVVNNVVSRPLSETTMPIYTGSEVYAPYTVLDSLTTLEYHYDTQSQQLIIMKDTQRLVFDLSARRTFDEQGLFYSHTAAYLNNTVYIPLGTICNRFNLYYSFTSYSLLAPMVRIHEGELVGSDIEFTSQLYSLLKTTYDTFLASTPDPISHTSYTPKDKLAYLAFYGNTAESGSDILNRLTDNKAAFFLNADEISQSGAFLRRASAEGHTIGIMLDAQSGISLTEQYNKANDSLRFSLSTVSRLVSIKDGSRHLTSEQLSELDALCVRIWDLGPSSEQLDDKELYDSIKNSKTTPVISLHSNGDTVQRLSGLFEYLSDNGYRLQPIHDWSTPVNLLNDIK